MTHKTHTEVHVQNYMYMYMITITCTQSKLQAFPNIYKERESERIYACNSKILVVWLINHSHITAMLNNKC